MPIEINRDNKKGFYFTVKAKNGQILCHSEGYTRKENCIKAIALVDDVFLMEVNMDGMPFDLKDLTNGIKKASLKRKAG